MNKYIPTIGLEIHAELKTQTKMFCSSKNDSDEKRPNYNVCPICLAHPGTLPVVNKEAVRYVLMVGNALSGTAADYTEFDRKNYFYPDLPKGYQISQYAYPMISGGSLSGVQITRIHLEEDTASSIHDDETGSTVIDYNRAGIPLMELVTEPVIATAEQAGSFARELQLLLRYLNVSGANMEKGEMRVEANISVLKSDLRNPDSKIRPLGTKVEVKNLNSFRIMEKAVAYEIKRQQELLERGEKVLQETRGWDENKGVTFSQRVKEGSADYRYFPDPDLPSLKLSLIPEFDRETLLSGMPELPSARRARYIGMGVKKEDADLYVRDLRLGAYFEAVAGSYPPESRELTLSSNYIANDLVKIIRDIEIRDTETQPESMGQASTSVDGPTGLWSATVDGIPISPEYFRKIIEMISSNNISSRSAKDILAKSAAERRNPAEIAQEMGLFQNNSESDVQSIVSRIVAENPKVVEDFKAGKKASLEYLIGQCMKASRGAADPGMLRKLVLEKLE